MNLDIAFGQYCEGNSFLHRLDPRAKIILSVLFIADVFITKNCFAFALLLVFTVWMIIASGIKIGIILKSLKPVIYIMIFTAVINVLWYEGTTLLLDLRFTKIYLEGIYNAGLVVLRVILLLMGTGVLLTYTTTPLSLTDGLERLLSPLAKIKVPVHEFALMMTIALRFIPTLMEETGKIMNAQKARGATFSEGSPVKRAKALIPILIPLFVSSFRRADDLAMAMECRCYRGGKGKTRMHVMHFSFSDFAFIAVLVALGAALVLINRYAPGFTMGW